MKSTPRERDLASPRSRKEREVCLDMMSGLKSAVHSISQKNKKSVARKIMCSFLAKKKNNARLRVSLGVSWRTWWRMAKDKKNGKRMSSSEVLKCMKFYKDVSIPIPGKRSVNKSMLPDTLKNLHRAYISKTTNQCASQCLRLLGQQMF